MSQYVYCNHIFNKYFRKNEFEVDLAEYLGEDWSLLPKSPELENYLQHLKNLERDKPILLLAYIYHLYLGMLSGGQILAKKRNLFGEGINTIILLYN